jgi:hypothetical protein
VNPAGFPTSQKFAVQDPDIQSFSTVQGNPKGHLYWHPSDGAPQPSSDKQSALIPALYNARTEINNIVKECCASLIIV